MSKFLKEHQEKRDERSGDVVGDVVTASKGEVLEKSSRRKSGDGFGGARVPRVPCPELRIRGT